MESDISRTISRQRQQEEGWRRRCGCLRTREKLKQMLDTFPPPPPPTPNTPKTNTTNNLKNTCISAFCTLHEDSPPNKTIKLCCDQIEEFNEEPPKKVSSKSWRILKELVQLIQLSVTATALALYYIIYCYMQLIYYSLRSALYFHNADGAMKITIAVVAITSLVVALNVILKIEKVIRIY